jgi:hypothetical protein
MNAGKLWVVVAVLGLTVSAIAATPTAPAAPAAPTAPAATMPASSTTPTKPVSTVGEGEIFGGVGYTFWTDYGWRGVNMTKALGGHRGTGASDMIYNLGTNIKDVGKVGVSFEQVYFNRYDDTDASLAFQNINVYITRQFDGIAGKFTFGYGNHQWTNAKGHVTSEGVVNGNIDSQEFYVTYGWDDGDMWKAITGNETGNIFNPSVTYLIDTENADNGQLAILNVNHPFNMGEVDSQLSNLSIIPTFSLTVDNRYYGPYFNNLLGDKPEGKVTKIGYMDYGMKAVADLTGPLGITTGKLTLQSGVGYIDGVELSDGKWYGNAGVAYNF